MKKMMVEHDVCPEFGERVTVSLGDNCVCIYADGHITTHPDNMRWRAPEEK